MSTVQKLWVGYRRAGGRATLELGSPGSRVLLLGSRSNDIAALSGLSAKEAGAQPIILDLGGSLSNRVSGYFDTFDYRSFLYDAFRLEAPEAWHCQLVAAAYATALDLSTEEEAIINAALQNATSEAMASPAAVCNNVAAVEGFRGYFVDKLKGRIASLKLLDAVDDQTFGRLLQGNALLDFHNAPYPQAAELAITLFFAKLLALAHSTGSPCRTLLLTEAHRVFRSSPRQTNASRLLTHLLEWSAPIIFSSDQQRGLSRQMVDACPIRIYSSDSWHSQTNHDERILSGTFVITDLRNGRRENFIPRTVVAKTSGYVPSQPAKYASPHLTSMILETADRFPLSTAESLVQYLTPEFLSADISAEVASLASRGCLIEEPKDSGLGSKIFAYTLSEKGRKLLQELTK
jgi:hypothetical protein